MSNFKMQIIGIATMLLVFSFIVLCLFDSGSHLIGWLSLLTLPVLQISLIIIYCQHIKNNDAILSKNKLYWFVAIFVFAVFSMPYYWYKHMLKSVQNHELI